VLDTVTFWSISCGCSVLHTDRSIGQGVTHTAATVLRPRRLCEAEREDTAQPTGGRARCPVTHAQVVDFPLEIVPLTVIFLRPRRGKKVI
jgi:hypothetical protein